jgi:hypothetical protein
LADTGGEERKGKWRDAAGIAAAAAGRRDRGEEEEGRGTG